MKLHDWIYEIVSEVCYDRDYLYACYIRHFTGLTNNIIETGSLACSGDYVIEGMKSNKNANISWQLERRIDWMGSNIINLDCKIRSQGSEIETLQAQFDMSTGDSC